VKTVLLDLNVLMALAWPTHEGHDAAHAWFQRLGKRPWASCLLTQLGFVRLSSNPAVVDPAPSPQRAFELLRAMLARPGHLFWPDDASVVEAAEWLPVWVSGHRQVTDARLIWLAQVRGGQLATFDGALKAAGAGLVEMIPVG